MTLEFNLAMPQELTRGGDKLNPNSATFLAIANRGYGYAKEMRSHKGLPKKLWEDYQQTVVGNVEDKDVRELLTYFSMGQHWDISTLVEPRFITWQNGESILLGLGLERGSDEAKGLTMEELGDRLRADVHGYFARETQLWGRRYSSEFSSSS